MKTSPPLPWAWWAVPLAIAALVLVLGELTDVDRAIMRLAFDPGSRSFPLRSNFWLEVVMHHWTKYAVAGLAGAAATRYVLGVAFPGLCSGRRLWLFLALALVLAPASVTLGKAASDRPCPWDIDEFGGHVRYTRLLEPPSSHIERGRCFPAGHASTGFALMAVYFVGFAARRRRAARWGLALGVGAGLVLGSGRILQGAHFLSHVLWSGLFCWTVMVVLYWMILHRSGEVAIGFVPLATTHR